MTATLRPRPRAPRTWALLSACLVVAATSVATAPAAVSQVPLATAVVSPIGASTTPETAFVPNQVVITAGSTLQYGNADTVQHNLTSADGLFASPFVGTGETAAVVGVDGLPPGTYDFLCTLHPTMTGVLTVLGDGGGGGGGGGGEPDPVVEEVDDDLVYETLANTNEPMALDIAEDGRIVWVERDGTVNVLVPGVPVPVPSQVLVGGNLCEPCTLADPGYIVEKLASDPEAAGDTPLGFGGPQEAGLYDVLLDDDFTQNDTLYLFYTVPASGQEVAPGIVWGEFRLSSFLLDPATNVLDPASEQTILSVPLEWNHPAHFGGDLDYLPDGTIVLTTGDNVLPASSGGYGPRDDSKHYLNAELTSANPADRRGKILRFREDGSVPDGSVAGEMPNPFLGMEGWNPYIEDTAANPFVGEFSGVEGDGWIRFDPYVYSMGWKQAWRSVVLPNGDLYVSDVGPDAGADDPARGPRGFEEINRVPYGGGTHHGWPRCQGPNWPYIDVDWETMEAGDPLDCSEDAVIARPVGATQPTVAGMSGATVWYPSGPCDGSQDDSTTYDCNQWPIVGSGGKTSEPTVFYPADAAGPYALPARYRDRMFVLEWSRAFILTVPADPVTGLLDVANDAMDRVNPPESSINPNLEEPQTSASFFGRYLSPIDAAIGPDGAVYFLEYGLTYYVGEVGRLSRLRAAEEQPAPEPSESEPEPGTGSEGEPGPPEAEGTDAPLPATGAGASLAVVAVLAAVGARRRRIVP